MSELPASQRYSNSFATIGKKTKRARQHGNAKRNPFLCSEAGSQLPPCCFPPRPREAEQGGQKRPREARRHKTRGIQLLGEHRKGQGLLTANHGILQAVKTACFRQVWWLLLLWAPPGQMGRRELQPHPCCKGRLQSPAMEAGVPLDPICSSMLLEKYTDKR